MNPQVIINDLGNCYVDGVNVGQPGDAIANNPQWASAIQTALNAFVANAAAQLAQAQADLAAAQQQIAALTPAPTEPQA